MNRLPKPRSLHLRSGSEHVRGDRFVGGSNIVQGKFRGVLRVASQPNPADTVWRCDDEHATTDAAVRCAEKWLTYWGAS
jgi:hypothetical protein